ncbi:hypothetical protein KEJ37_00305 [Candidatus Bathyarchaeota archaeon]|nr:hypothetical protein [Candidatus Bathyarchaeota archaeon]
MPPQELPKISSFTQLLAAPETQFESLVKEALKVELPPGPQSTLLKLQTSLEAGKAPSSEAVVPKAPKLPEVLGKLPTLPKLEDILPSVEKRGEYQLSGAKEEKPKTGYVMSR